MLMLVNNNNNKSNYRMLTAASSTPLCGQAGCEISASEGSLLLSGLQLRMQPQIINLSWKNQAIGREGEMFLFHLRSIQICIF